MWGQGVIGSGVNPLYVNLTEGLGVAWGPLSERGGGGLAGSLGRGLGFNGAGELWLAGASPEH